MSASGSTVCQTDDSTQRSSSSTSAVESWVTDGALELQDEALHPLQLAGTVGCDGPCSYTPCACDTWLSLTKIQNASALNKLGLHCMQDMPKHCCHTLTGNQCLPLLLGCD